MIRTLLIITAAGLVIFFLSAGAFVSMGGVQAIQQGDFQFGDRDWDSDHRHGGRHADGRGEPRAERTLDWAGGDSLTFDLSAEATYSQGPVAAITVTGPKSLVDDVVIENGRIGFRDQDGHHRGMHAWRHGRRPLRIAITAPAVKAFTINGSADLQIRGYDQPDLTIQISGSGDVNGAGRTGALKLAIAGSGDADLQSLPAATARVSVAGSGDARVDATESADVAIAGSGDVHLSRRPPTLTSDIAGSGDLDFDQ